MAYNSISMNENQQHPEYTVVYVSYRKSNYLYILTKR